ncbi:DUF883 domain-containing protein [Rhodobacteraceae bacterium D3-12]|nr:DUF883 domain-containing protein [Rhodobacteraceae bacterium D3-12]
MARTSTNGSAKDATVADLSAEIETLRKDLGSLTDTIAELGKSKASALKDAASERVKSARDTAQQKGAEAAEKVGAQAQYAQTQANEFIQQKPATAMGIAAGVGFLVGMLSTRR